MPASLAPRVLDPEHHPIITFDSERPGPRDIPGALTVLGVTRAVRLRVTELTVAPGSFTARATARIDRTEFGVTAYRGLARRYLDMSVEVQCIPDVMTAKTVAPSRRPARSSWPGWPRATARWRPCAG